MPFPRDETTPPVMKMYFVLIVYSSCLFILDSFQQWPHVPCAV
jgi:hypothetical protein